MIAWALSMMLFYGVVALIAWHVAGKIFAEKDKNVGKENNSLGYRRYNF